jgi:hypothetical protein
MNDENEYSYMKKANPTPLWKALSDISSRKRMSLLLITINHTMGYKKKMRFATAEHLYLWLGGSDKHNVRPMGESYEVAGFDTLITLPQLLSNVKNIQDRDLKRQFIASAS